MLDKKEKRNMSLKGVKMYNAGMKRNQIGLCEPSSSSSEDKMSYPSLYLNAEQAPSLSGYEVEDDVMLLVKGKITGYSKNERKGGDIRETFDVEIRKIGCLKKKEEY